MHVEKYQNIWKLGVNNHSLNEQEQSNQIKSKLRNSSASVNSLEYQLQHLHITAQIFTSGFLIQTNVNRVDRDSFD